MRSRSPATITPLQEQSAAACAARGAEAERQRLREALHDGLGQLLTSISFLADSLRGKLAAQHLPETGDAEEIVALTRQAISKTQALFPAEDARPSGA